MAASNHELYRKAAKAWVAAASEQPPEAIYWEGEGVPIADPRIVLATVTETDLLQRSEIEISDPDVDGSTYELETLQNMKELSLQIRVETVSQADGSGALQLCESIRMRAMSETFCRIAKALGLNILDGVGDVVNLSYDSQDYKIHARAFELKTRTVFTEIYRTDGSEWFNKIGFALNIKDEFDTPETEVSAT